MKVLERPRHRMDKPIFDITADELKDIKIASEFYNRPDLISRTFIWILENGNLHYSQAQLNAAKKALIPLWELSRFSKRYVYPNQ